MTWTPPRKGAWLDMSLHVGGFLGWNMVEKTARKIEDS